MSRKLLAIATLVGIVIVVLGCNADQPPALEPPPPLATGAVATPSSDQLITLGGIDPDEPTKKLKRFQPLADNLAEHLESLEIQGGQVVIARDIEEMAHFMADGTVDIYFDSAFPSLAVQEISGSEIILRSWKKEDPEYWSIYIALRDKGIGGVEGFLGEVLAFEEPHSTSGFVLPAGTLIQRGYTLRGVDGPDAYVALDEIGYIFSRDEDNTVEFVIQGRVAGGALSNQDYDELGAELQERVVAFDPSMTVPRQLVSVRPGLDAGLVAKVKALLIALDQTDEGRLLLEGLKSTKKFDSLPAGSKSALDELKELMKLVFG